MLLYLNLHGVHQRFRRRDEERGRVAPVFRLVEHVSCNNPRVGMLIGDDDTFGRTEQHHGRAPVELDDDLRCGHGGSAWSQHFRNPRENASTKRESRDARWAVRANDPLQTQLMRNNEYGGIDRTIGTGHRRHDNSQLRHAGDDGRRPDLDQDRRERAFAARHEEPGRIDRAGYLADEMSRFDLGAPRGVLDHAFVEGPAVGDSPANRDQQARRDACHRRVDLSRRHE